MWNFGTYVDGTNNFSKWLTLQRAPQRGSGGFAIETVKEVNIITNQFSAEFGGHSAGVMSMITKSGTNAVAGSAFAMVRPGDWDAKPPLSPTKTPYNQQQYGQNQNQGQGQGQGHDYLYPPPSQQRIYLQNQNQSHSYGECYNYNRNNVGPRGSSDHLNQPNLNAQSHHIEEGRPRPPHGPPKGPGRGPQPPLPPVPAPPTR